MGRYYFDAKSKVEDLNRLDINWLRREGYLNYLKSGFIFWTWYRSERKSSITIASGPDEHYIDFSYTQTDNMTGEKKEFDYQVKLTTTPCNLGGKRYWFICPLSRAGVFCGRRVGILYKGGDYFGCRHCYRLTYSSREYGGGSRFYQFSKALAAEDKASKLESSMRTRIYRGKPTRRYLRLLKLRMQSRAASWLWLEGRL